MDPKLIKTTGDGIAPAKIVEASTFGMVKKEKGIFKRSRTAKVWASLAIVAAGAFGVYKLATEKKSSPSIDATTQQGAKAGGAKPEVESPDNTPDTQPDNDTATAPNPPPEETQDSFPVTPEPHSSFPANSNPATTLPKEYAFLPVKGAVCGVTNAFEHPYSVRSDANSNVPSKSASFVLPDGATVFIMGPEGNETEVTIPGKAKPVWVSSKQVSSRGFPCPGN